MENMEHMTMRWVAVKDPDTHRWGIQSVGAMKWEICGVWGGCCGDPTGELTARAICDAHNAALDAKPTAQASNLPTRKGLIVAAVQGLCANPGEYEVGYDDYLAGKAIKAADAVLAALEKEGAK